MLVNVSIGEAIDKYSILELKNKLIKDELKLIEINKELFQLEECKKYINNNQYYYNILFNINKEIWELTDIIKSINYTNSDFAKISFEIFELNQKRFRVKNFFNLLNDSNLKEQKSYSSKSCVIKISNSNILNEKIAEINYLSIEYDIISFDCDFTFDIKYFKIPNLINNNTSSNNDYINLSEYNILEKYKNIY
jgi:hypothetical protein